VCGLAVDETHVEIAHGLRGMGFHDLVDCACVAVYDRAGVTAMVATHRDVFHIVGIVVFECERPSEDKAVLDKVKFEFDTLMGGWRGPSWRRNS